MGKTPQIRHFDSLTEEQFKAMVDFNGIKFGFDEICKQVEKDFLMVNLIHEMAETKNGAEASYGYLSRQEESGDDFIRLDERWGKLSFDLNKYVSLLIHHFIPFTNFDSFNNVVKYLDGELHKYIRELYLSLDFCHVGSNSYLIIIKTKHSLKFSMA